MKKIQAFIILVVLFFISAPSANCQKVYCVYKRSDGNTIGVTYDTSKTDARCEVWRDEFWQKHNPSAYNDCLRANSELKAAYSSGKCSPIVTKVHNFGATSCKVELNYKHKKLISTMCSGPETSKYLKQLKQMYR